MYKVYINREVDRPSKSSSKGRINMNLIFALAIAMGTPPEALVEAYDDKKLYEYASKVQREISKKVKKINENCPVDILEE